MLFHQIPLFLLDPRGLEAMKREILEQSPHLARKTKLAIFKHATDDDGLKVKALIYTEEEDATGWRVVMGTMKRCCICESSGLFQQDLQTCYRNV